MNSRFFVHIADQQLQHYALSASQTLQSSRLTPKPRSLGPGQAPDVEVVYIACSVGAYYSPVGTAQVQVVASVEMELRTPEHDLGMIVYVAAAAVAVPVPEMMNNAGSPEVNLELAVGLEYRQDG